MKAKKFFSLLLVLVICLNSVSMTAMAAESEPHTKANVARATGRFSMDVPGGALVKASSSFPLEAGETVTIKATYTPFSASVDFGLIAPDGYFYYPEAVAPEGKTRGSLLTCTVTQRPETPEYTLSVEILATAVQSQPASAVTDAWGVTPPFGN